MFYCGLRFAVDTFNFWGRSRLLSFNRYHVFNVFIRASQRHMLLRDAGFMSTLSMMTFDTFIGTS